MKFLIFLLSASVTAEALSYCQHSSDCGLGACCVRISKWKSKCRRQLFNCIEDPVYWRRYGETWVPVVKPSKSSSPIEWWHPKSYGPITTVVTTKPLAVKSDVKTQKTTPIAKPYASLTNQNRPYVPVTFAPKSYVTVSNPYRSYYVPVSHPPKSFVPVYDRKTTYVPNPYFPAYRPSSTKRDKKYTAEVKPYSYNPSKYLPSYPTKTWRQVPFVSGYKKSSAYGERINGRFVKPGYCPPIWKVDIWRYQRFCNDDNYCLYDQKCCRQLCMDPTYY
ncbi:Uncharacterised protein g10185 [Pycnogonum litorale]